MMYLVQQHTIIFQRKEQLPVATACCAAAPRPARDKDGVTCEAILNRSVSTTVFPQWDSRPLVELSERMACSLQRASCNVC